MGNVFSGLESMGLVGLSKVSIYDEEKKENKAGTQSSPAEKVISESDFIFEKNVQCPVCDKEFKSKTVKTGKPRLIGSDSDLRPKYSGIDSIKYDAIVCPHCGYAALSRFFGYMTTAQAKLIKDNISCQFEKLPETGTTYTYDEAINRHKLALFNAVVKHSRVSERAYTCLKLAWLFRGKREALTSDMPNYAAMKKECEDNEMEMLKNTYDGFIVSRSKEEFPICGMDEATFDYLLADIAARLGNFEASGKFATAVIMSRTANPRLKEKARDLREGLKERMNSGK